jgi:hypothetical protein
LILFSSFHFRFHGNNHILSHSSDWF